jgi:hypothetical protein
MLLTNLLQNVLSDLGQTDPDFGNFVATGGGATTIINTDWGNLESPPETDALKNRIAFIISTTDGLTPQGKWSKVSAYADATYTCTIATVTDVVQAGDVVMLAKQTLFPLQESIFRVNRALTNLGQIPLVDTSLTTAADQTEYVLPVAVKNKLLKVYMQTETGDADDNKWAEIFGWRLDPTAAGSTGILVLPQLIASRTLKLVYMGIHPTVSVYSDTISEYVHPKVATLAAMIELLAWYNNRDENQGANEYFVWLIGQKQQELERAKMEQPIWKPTDSAKWFMSRSKVIDRSPQPFIN